MKKGDRISYNGKPGVIVDLDLTPGMADIRLDSESFVRRARKNDLQILARPNGSAALVRRNAGDIVSKEMIEELSAPHRPIGPMTYQKMAEHFGLTQMELYEKLVEAKRQTIREDKTGENWILLLNRLTSLVQKLLPAPTPTILHEESTGAGFTSWTDDQLRAEGRRERRQAERLQKSDQVKQGTISLDLVKRRGAAFYSRVDAPRLSPDRVNYFGNPIDGTAYYLILDNTTKVTGRWLTWEDLEIFRDEDDSDESLAEFVPLAIEFAEQDGWQKPKKVKLIVQEDNREILFDRPSSYRFASRPTIARPASTSVKTGGDVAVNLQTVYAEETNGEDGPGVYGWYFYGSRIPVAHEILKRYFSPFGPPTGNRLYSFLSRGRTLLEEIVSQTKAPISKSTADLLIRSGAAFCTTQQSEEYRQAMLKKRRNRFAKRPKKTGLNGVIFDPSTEIPAGTKIFFGLQDKRRSPFFAWVPSRDPLDFEILDAPTSSQKEEDFSLRGLASVLRNFYSRLRSVKSVYDNIVDDRQLSEASLDSALDGLSRAVADLSRWFSNNAGASNPSSVAVMEFLFRQPTEMKKALLSIPMRGQDLGLIEAAEKGDRIWYAGRMTEEEGRRMVIPPSVYLNDLLVESSDSGDLWSSLFKGLRGYGNPFEGLIGLIELKSPKKAAKIKKLIEENLQGDYFGVESEEKGRKAREARYRIISIIGKATESDPELRDLVWAQTRVLDLAMDSSTSQLAETAAYLAKVYYQLSGYYLAGPLRDEALVAAARSYSTNPKDVGYSFQVVSSPDFQISFVKQEGGFVSVIEIRDADGNPLAALVPHTSLPQRTKRDRRLSERAGDLPLHRRKMTLIQKSPSLKSARIRPSVDPDRFKDLPKAGPRSPGQTTPVTTKERKILWLEAQTERGKFRIAAAQPSRLIVQALRAILIDGDDVSEHFDPQTGALRAQRGSAAFPRLLEAIEIRATEVRQMGSVGAEGSGRRGFSKNANVTVFKTYNPALFQVTRLFWPMKEGQRGEFSRGSTLPGVWSRADIVKDIDIAGIYGRLVAFTQKTILHSTGPEVYDALAVRRLSEPMGMVSSGEPEKIGAVLMDRDGVYQDFNLLWPAGVDPTKVADVIAEMVMDPNVSLDRWRDAFQEIAQKMNFWGLRGLPRTKATGTGSKILAEILTQDRVVTTKPSTSSEQAVREKTLSMIRSIDPNFPAKFSSAEQESEALRKFQRIRKLPETGAFDRSLISWLLDRLQKPEKAQAPLQQIPSLDMRNSAKQRMTFPPSSSIRQLEESERRAKLIEAEIDRAIRLLDQMDQGFRKTLASPEMIERARKGTPIAISPDEEDES